jgi:hypothetical protein
MINKNIATNLLIKQMNQSDAIAYRPGFLASPTDSEFGVLNKAYENTGTLYAQLKTSIENNQCSTPNCEFETKRLRQLEAAPQVTMEFISSFTAEIATVEEPNFDPNNNYAFTLAHAILTKKPSFSMTDGYMVELHLLEDSSQQLFFTGPGFEEPLSVNSSSLKALLDSGTAIVASTPNIEGDMSALLLETGLFDVEDTMEDGSLGPNASIVEEFVLKNPDGSFDYEILDIGGGKGRNILKYDIDKIDRKATPFIEAEIAGLFSSEQFAVAAWNVYISKGTTASQDDQMVQDANAGDNSWSYEFDLPLQNDKKELFSVKYKEYFMNNYLMQFTKNQLPAVPEDSAIFDLAEAQQAKAQKFLDDNNLN